MCLSTQKFESEKKKKLLDFAGKFAGNFMNKQKQFSTVLALWMFMYLCQ